MNIHLICTGKTTEKYLDTGISEYIKRVSKYTSFHISYTKDIKINHFSSIDELKKSEAQLIFAKLKSSDFVVLLDEKGSELSSVEFAHFIQQHLNRATKNLVFVIGGPYGFAPELYERSNAKISLSRMTFSHQMVRLLFVEQLYRSFTIIFNEPYHHQ